MIKISGFMYTAEIYNKLINDAYKEEDLVNFFVDRTEESYEYIYGKYKIDDKKKLDLKFFCTREDMELLFITSCIKGIIINQEDRNDIINMITKINEETEFKDWETDIKDKTSEDLRDSKKNVNTSVIYNNIEEILEIFREIDDKDKLYDYLVNDFGPKIVEGGFSISDEEKTNYQKELLANQQAKVSNDRADMIRQYSVKMLHEETRPSHSTFYDVLGDVDKYTNKAKYNNDNLTGLEDMVNIALTIITNIGMIVAILMSAIVGVKYMLGSVEEKAEYKKDMIPYLIGAMLLFGISTILKIVQGIAKNINN